MISALSAHTNPYQGRTVVVGVAGGIAAYKAAYLVRLLVKAGAEVQVVMSKAATEFVGPVTFQALSGRQVFVDLWNLEEESEIGHIKAADGADLVIVAPATANVIARIAAGRAGDALSAVVLATRAPVLLAPSMNVNMWEHPATQRNLATLQKRPNVHTVGPGVGFLACRWEGAGRLAEPDDIAEAGAHVLSPSDLAGRRIVVTAGPTREPLDPVRFLTNRSSGKMGYAVARAAARRGAVVDLISGPVELSAPPSIRRQFVETAAEMESATRAAASGADAVIMVAAVSDLRPKAPKTAKLKKATLGEAPSLPLATNADILAGLGRDRRGRRPVLIGFAAETPGQMEPPVTLEELARTKLRAKKVDLIVANDVSATEFGFGADQNRVLFVDDHGSSAHQAASKDAIGHAICTRLVGLLDSSVDSSASSSASSSDAQPSDPTAKVVR